MPASRAVTLLLLATPVFAQHRVYDAGVAGDPPTAPNPMSQGWSLDLVGPVGLNPISPDPSAGINAWEVADNTAAGHASYEASFPVPNVFEYTLTMRVTAGPSYTISFEVQDGFTLADNLWRVGFRVSGSDVIAREAHLQTEYTCAGGADGGYHTFAMRMGVGTLENQLLYDGVVVGIVHDTFPDASQNTGIRWGAHSNSGLGRSRFHRVEFTALPGPIGTSLGCLPALPNSTGGPSEIAAQGTPQIGSTPITLTVTQLPQNQFGYFLVSQTTGSSFPPGSQGRLCLSGSIGRFVRPGEIRFSGATGSFALDVDLLDVPSPPGQITPGSWYFQSWYRDANPTQTSNFTPYVRIDLQ
ncbi:MAG: hypothetical protein GY711_25975 [bacterium]|nr:hypothetical protein [bacterium]